jgi:hypothetical protein
VPLAIIEPVFLIGGVIGLIAVAIFGKQRAGAVTPDTPSR